MGSMAESVTLSYGATLNPDCPGTLSPYPPMVWHRHLVGVFMDENPRHNDIGIGSRHAAVLRARRFA